MILWHDVKQGSPAWKRLRKKLWTGSIALRLLQGKSLPREYEWGGNSSSKRGQMLEYAAIREYEREYGRKVARPGFVTNSVYPNAGYSPDGIDGPWLLESKSFALKNDQALRDGKIPLTVLVQIYFGMIITDLRRARLLAFNPDEEQQLVVIEIAYDKIIGANIRKKLRLDIKKRRNQ